MVFTNFWEGVRSLGARGVVANLLVADGALFSSLYPIWAGYLEEPYGTDVSRLARDDMMLWMTSWILGLHCRAHILSLAISWGVHVISEKEILGNVFLGIRGLLRSGYALDQKVSASVNSSVAYRGLPDEETEDDVRFFWTLLLGGFEAPRPFSYGPTRSGMMIGASGAILTVASGSIS